MPRKSKEGEAEKPPTITVSEAKPVEVKKMTVPIRCVWDSRLIVGADKTPTGTRYEFMPGQELPVNEIDYEYLLSLEVKAPGCCGGYGGASTIGRQRYFEAVEV